MVFLDASKPVAIITGTGSGLGRACVESFSKNGFNVIAVSRSKCLNYDLDENVKPYLLDITSGYGLQDFVDLIKSLNISVLINNAGQDLGWKPIDQVSKELEDNLNLNFLSHIRLIQAVVPIFKIKKSGHIVNISSPAAIEINPQSSFYGVAKNANSFITKALRSELSNVPIKVTEILPGAMGEGGMDYDDVARSILWVCNSPSSINVDVLKISRT
jgi:NADP-dependent 3-hydroxy acid dehydrogenase YdfG